MVALNSPSFSATAPRNSAIWRSASGSAAEAHQDWTRGIRVGSAKDGSVKYLIPDPDKTVKGTSAAEGCAADKDGIIYGAEVGQMDVKKYVKK